MTTSLRPVGTTLAHSCTAESTLTSGSSLVKKIGIDTMSSSKESTITTVTSDADHPSEDHHHPHDHHHHHHGAKAVTSALDPEVEDKGVAEVLKGLSDEEKAELVDETMPLRHLRAEKGHVDKALHDLKETLKWRKSFGVDKIVNAVFGDNIGEDDNEAGQMLRKETETGKIYVRGYDQDGRALMYMRPQRENTHNHENNMKNLVYNLERAIACTKKKSNHTQEKVCLIIDFDGFQLRTAPPLSVSRMTLDILQKHYPERMHRAYVCNAPFIFRTFFLMVRPFIDPLTKQKICICHGKQGLQTLQEHIDVHVLEPSILSKLPKEGNTTPAAAAVLREFDNNEYLTSPFDTTFDEK